MKRAYRVVNFREASLIIVARANLIIEEYAGQGYALTLRQLYYQLVARGFIENKVSEYQKLSQIMTKARYGGYTDWDGIVDRIRKPQILYSVRDKSHAIRDTIEQYRLDRQKGQPNYIEVWCEKDALSGILLRVTEEFHVRLMINRGYSSASAMRIAARRFRARHHNEQNCLLFYIGDHDPSGLDMIRDIRDRLTEFGAIVEVQQIALTMDQIEEYNPPKNPAKESDPRSDWYINKFGESSWEVDALRPEVLHELIQSTIESDIDMKMFEAMKEKEESDRKKLEELAIDFEDELEEE